MNRLSKVLREKKIKITPQRMAVYKILAGSPEHISAEEVYQRVKEEVPAISLATVYAILEHFEQDGLIHSVRIDAERAFYEIRTDGHHHFLCRNCNRIFDVNIQPCPTLTAKTVDGHIVDDFQGYFFGCCRQCRKE